MTTVNRMDGHNIVITKGAFDMLAPRCIAGNLDAAAAICDEMSASALRVLAVAYKEINVIPESPTSETLENELTFLGLVGMIDPPRPEAAVAVATCRQAGIKPVMITGDHVVTASAIARELGILTESDRAITGLELDAIDRRMLLTIIRNYGGGPVGLETLAAAIGEEAVTLEDVYEPYLMQIGFLSRTPRGRCVTPMGYRHLGIAAPGEENGDQLKLDL